MYVRVLSFVCREDVSSDEIKSVYQEVTNEAESLDGFLGASLLMGEESCRGMALIYWRDHDAASAAGPRLVSVLGQRIHEILVHPPEITGYNVLDSFVTNSNRSETGPVPDGWTD